MLNINRRTLVKVVSVGRELKTGNVSRGVYGSATVRTVAISKSAIREYILSVLNRPVVRISPPTFPPRNKKLH